MNSLTRKKRIANNQVELVAPLQNDTTFHDDTDFWKGRMPEYYKVYLLAENFVKEGKHIGCSLFWVDTTVSETLFLGRIKQ